MSEEKKIDSIQCKSSLLHRFLSVCLSVRLSVWVYSGYIMHHYNGMSANDQGIVAVTGRANCQRQVAFFY